MQFFENVKGGEQHQCENKLGIQKAAQLGKNLS